jgi:hypothetical protein
MIVDTMVKDQGKTDVLKVGDRCDRCNSQAFIWVNGVSGDLLFCRHHFLKHEDAIRAYAFEVVDETWKINHKSESSA